MNETENIECVATGNMPQLSELLLSNATTKLVGIYGLQNKLKPDRWYIGGSINIKSRWNKYKNGICKSQPKLYRAIKKYGYNGFNKYIIELCNPDIPEEALNKKETTWIKHYNSCYNGYNCTEDGTIRMLVRTKEHNRKIGDANKGKVHTHKHIVSEETRMKIRLAHKGVKRGPQSETRKKNTSKAMKQYYRDNPASSQTIEELKHNQREYYLKNREVRLKAANDRYWKNKKE